MTAGALILAGETPLEQPGVQRLNRGRLWNGRQIIGPRELHQPFDLALVVAFPRPPKAIVKQKMADKPGKGLCALPLAVA